MKSFAAALALAAAAMAPVALADASSLTIDSLASIVQCQPIKFTWSGGVPPYYLSLVPADQPTAPPMKMFPVQQGTSYTWTVDLGAGTSFTTVIKDSTGQPNYSSEQVVQNGTDTSCLNASVTETNTVGNGGATATSSASLTASVAAAAVTGSSTSSGSASTHASMSTGASTGTGTATTSHSSTSTATATNAASTSGSVMGIMGLAGVVGLIGAAFM